MATWSELGGIARGLFLGMWAAVGCAPHSVLWHILDSGCASSRYLAKLAAPLAREQLFARLAILLALPRGICYCITAWFESSAGVVGHLR